MAHRASPISKPSLLSAFQHHPRSRFISLSSWLPRAAFGSVLQPNWKGGAAHPAPRRAIFITVRGEYQVTPSDGVARRFAAGSVVIVEDTTGDGHSTTITSDVDCIVFAVGLPTTGA